MVYEAGPTGSGWRGRAGGGDRGDGLLAGRDPAPARRSDQDRHARCAQARAACTRRPAAAVVVPAPELEALRDLVRAREDLRGDLMACAASDQQAAAAPRRCVFDGPGRHWTHAPPAVARHGRASASRCVAARARRVSRPPRGAARAPRRLDALIAEQAADGAVGADRRPAALPARHRHAHRGRPERRDRRLRRVRAPAAAGQLPRPRPVRAAPPAHGAGRARSPRPAPATPAGCSSRPPGTTAARRASRSTLARRQAGQPPAAIDAAWRAQLRLHRRWAHLDARARQAAAPPVAVAVARELACFFWAIARQPD